MLDIVLLFNVCKNIDIHNPNEDYAFIFNLLPSFEQRKSFADCAGETIIFKYVKLKIVISLRACVVQNSFPRTE